MQLDQTGGGDPLRFILIDKTPQSDLRLLCQAPNEETLRTWLETIRALLDMQGDFLRGLSVCLFVCLSVCLSISLFMRLS